MKILLINKFYHLHRGAERIFLDTKRLLESHGHQVVVFSMKHPKNLTSPYEKYFVDQVETFEPNFWQGLRAFGRALYSRQAARRLEALIKAEKPDLAHLHNIYHQISPSILGVLKKYQIPVVLTAHDFKLVCPSYQLNKNGVKCPRNIFLHALHCAYHRPIYHGSTANSILGNLAAAVEWLIHKILRVYERNIDLVLTPTRFMASLFVEYGWPGAIEVLPHFSSLLGDAKLSDDYVLFVGHLSPEKGIDILVETAKKLPSIPFVVVGEKRMELPNLPNLKYLGYKTGAELEEMYRRAALIFAPSRFQESFGLQVMEAALFGVPAVASSLGAFPEMIKNNQTGLLFDPTGEDAVNRAAELVRSLWENGELRKTLGQNAKAFAETMSSPEGYIKKLEAIYLALLSKKSGFPS